MQWEQQIYLKSFFEKRNIMKQTTFYDILQGSDGTINAVENDLNKILFGIKECFSKLWCGVARAGVLRASGWIRAAV